MTMPQRSQRNAPDGCSESGAHEPDVRPPADLAVDARIPMPRLVIVGPLPSSTEWARAQLAEAGYHDVTVAGLASAAEFIAQQRPDVVLIDMVAPEPSGLGVLGEIRRGQRTSHLPCVVLASAGDHAIKARAWELGATDFLAKPIDPTELHARIRNAMWMGAMGPNQCTGRTREQRDLCNSILMRATVPPQKDAATAALSLDELFPTQLSWPALQQSCFQQLKSTAKIMIVDDDPVTIILVRECLADAGYSCFVTTDDATRAVEMIVGEEPDLVLLDVMMPGISGLAILEKIRADERFMDLPIIILTASTVQDTKQRALDLGTTEFLTKPIDPTEVLPRVRNALVVKAHQDHFKEYARELEREVTRQIRRVRDYAAAMEKANQVLQQSQSAAQAASRAKSHFLANMSHEIRTPLTSMIGFAELVLDDADRKGMSPCDVSNLEVVLRNGRHLLDIINDVLDLSKIEAGHLEVELMSCHVRQIVTEAVQSIRIQAEAKGLSVQVEWATPVPETIRSDPTCLRRILINLMGNAVKFTSQGSVRLIIRLLDHDSAEPQLQFEVVDTGIGIPRDQWDSLFKPFVQADVSYRRRFGGTGLGLTISKQLVEKLGGIIDVESEPGLGTAFRVAVPAGPLDRVPMLDNPRDPMAEAQDSQRRSGELRRPDKLCCRVLVAEDSPDCQRLITLILRNAGAEVVVVKDGQAAFEAAMSSGNSRPPFDIILMDMQMPVLDGYAATRKLRDAGFTRPIIALTAHTMSCEREKCLAAGCDDFASKPIDRQALLELVSDYATLRRRAEFAAGT